MNLLVNDARRRIGTVRFLMLPIMMRARISPFLAFYTLFLTTSTFCLVSLISRGLSETRIDGSQCGPKWFFLSRLDLAQVHIHSW